MMSERERIKREVEEEWKKVCRNEEREKMIKRKRNSEEQNQQ